MAENELLIPECSEMLLIPTKYWTVTCNLTVTSPQGNLATGNLATDLVTSPQKAEEPSHSFGNPATWG